MWEGTATIQIEASPEAVWSVISDLTRHAELAGSGEIMTITDISGPLAVGTTFASRNKIKMIGDLDATEEIIECEPRVALGWRSIPPPIVKKDPSSRPDITWRYALAGTDGTTTVTHSFRVVPPKKGGLQMKLFYLVSGRAKALRRGMEGTLRNLKAAAESEAGEGVA